MMERSEEHTSELQSRPHLVCRLLLEKKKGAKPEIVATGDRRSALAGATYVINTIQVGGFPATRRDFDIPAGYGLRQTIADTIGIGGIFRALRTFPVLAGIADDMAGL